MSPPPYIEIQAGSDSDEPSAPDSNPQLIQPAFSDGEESVHSDQDADYSANLDHTDEDSEDIPTDEDDPGSLEDFIVNGDEDEGGGESSEEEGSDDEEDEESSESEEEFDPAYDSDDSYEPPVPICQHTKPVRRSTRKRKVRQIYQPEVSDIDSDEDAGNGDNSENDEDGNGAYPQ